MGENFAFFLPVMMASFGAVFLTVSHWHIPVARLWSGGFFCVGAGLATAFGYTAAPSPVWGMLASVLFAVGFLCFSEALLHRWRPFWMLRTRIAIGVVSALLSGIAAAVDNLPLEFATSDLGCFLLIAIPLIAGRKHLKQWRDRALFSIATLIALDYLIRGSAVPFIMPASGQFYDSEYAYVMQALGCVLGLFLALTALSANMLDLVERYQRDAQIDPLTNLLNRRGFDDRVRRISPLDKESSLIVCDIDRFKNINDRFGHANGDRVIVLLADMLRQIAPGEALVARFGGEEFVLLLPGISTPRAFIIANVVREMFKDEAGKRLGFSSELTASFGVAWVGRSQRVADAIIRADHALYEAKAKGRNRVCISRPLSRANIQATERILKIANA